MSGEFFDNGIFRVFIPTGWLSFYGIDSDGKTSPKKLHIYKNAETELDIFTKAGITVCFYGKNEIYLSPKAFYDDACDMEPFKIGNNLWNGFTCTSFNYPYIMLDSSQNDMTFQVMILIRNGQHEISLYDEDVQAVLGSLEFCE